MPDHDYVICECTACSKFTTSVDGVKRPGREVHRSTRYDHHRARPPRAKRKRRASSAPRPSETQRPIDIDIPITLIVRMCCLLVIWLHVSTGVSRKRVNSVLRALELIITTTLHLVVGALRASNINVLLPSVTMPRDVRSLYRMQHIEPDIVRTICCSKCFALYDGHAPPRCTFRELPNSPACDTALWKTRITKKGAKLVPRRQYTTQSFDSWLRFFLSRSVIDDALHASYIHGQQAVGAHGGEMRDVKDAPAWQDMQAGQDSPYSLVFSIYVDWFNPFTNKIAGKVSSCGVIALHCLNLPPHLRYRPENVYIAGITPPPAEPSPTTISHILNPLVTSILPFDTPGRILPTFRNPQGTPVIARMIPLIADSPASKKVGGFLSHSALLFCSFCLCLSDDVERLTLTAPSRNGPTVRAQAQVWLNQSTKSGRETRAKETGVRWTSLHLLPYRDPVKHTILGCMHNWLEGVLQNHLRNLLGIGRDVQGTRQAAELEQQERWTEAELSESADEVDDLRQEAEEADDAGSDTMRTASSTTPTPSHPDQPSGRFSRTQLSRTTSGASSSSASVPPDVDALFFETDWSEDDEDDPDYFPTSETPFEFTPVQLQLIRGCIAEATLPTWVGRPPTNLGEASHGKLKASDELTLFTCLLPLVLPELWYSAQAPAHSLDYRLLENFHNLVSATNIICSFATSDSAADDYDQHYLHYRQSCLSLFPDAHSKPNHHYAMHNTSLLKYWGPLAALSEFAGERLNGTLQEIKTNSHQNDLDLTMMRQICRRGRLEAQLQDEPEGGELRQLSALLSDGLKDEDPDGSAASTRPTSTEKILAPDAYNALLHYLQQTGRPYRRWNDFPHPPNSLVLQRTVNHLANTQHQDRTLSTYQAHEGGSAVEFYNPLLHARGTGSVQQIWSTTLHVTHEKQHTFLIIRPFQPLTAHEEAQAPFSHFPGLRSRIVDATSTLDLIIVKPPHIITHLVTWHRPLGTYNIPKETLVVCHGLDRRRSQ